MKRTVILAALATLTLSACAHVPQPFLYDPDNSTVSTQVEGIYVGNDQFPIELPVEDDDEADEATDDDAGDTDGDASGGGSGGNASANNGKGGNYDKTGHTDNGKGKGRDRK